MLDFVPSLNILIYINLQTIVTMLVQFISLIDFTNTAVAYNHTFSQKITSSFSTQLNSAVLRMFLLILYLAPLSFLYTVWFIKTIDWCFCLPLEINTSDSGIRRPPVLVLSVTSAERWCIQCLGLIMESKMRKRKCLNIAILIFVSLRYQFH